MRRFLAALLLTLLPASAIAAIDPSEGPFWTALGYVIFGVPAIAVGFLLGSLRLPYAALGVLIVVTGLLGLTWTTYGPEKMGAAALMIGTAAAVFSPAIGLGFYYGRRSRRRLPRQASV